MDGFLEQGSSLSHTDVLLEVGWVDSTVYKLFTFIVQVR